MRPRFNRNRLASSDNYEASRRLHTEYIQEQHEKNIKEVEIITASVIVKRVKYVKVFNKLVPISEEEYQSHSTLITL